jgi:hypothetical protein
MNVYDHEMKKIRFEYFYCELGLLVCYTVFFILSFVPWLAPAIMAHLYSNLNSHMKILTIPMECIYILRISAALSLILTIIFWKFNIFTIRNSYVKMKKYYQDWKNI